MHRAGDAVGSQGTSGQHPGQEGQAQGPGETAGGGQVGLSLAFHFHCRASGKFIHRQVRFCVCSCFPADTVHACFCAAFSSIGVLAYHGNRHIGASSVVLFYFGGGGGCKGDAHTHCASLLPIMIILDCDPAK